MVKRINRLVNSGTSARGFTAPDMVSIPVISTAKPMRIWAIFLCLSFLEIIRIPTPISARTGEKEDGFNSFKKKLPPSIPARLKIQLVMVVPMLAPMIMPIAWDNFIIPELTNPTTMTVVAEEDCITAVTPAPRSTALKRLEVRLSSICSSRPPDSLERPSPSTCIPYKNRARPPNIVNNPKKSMLFSPCLYLD